MPTLPGPIKHICIVGAGSAGYLSAVTLKRLLPGVEVTVVHSANIPVIGVGESTTDLFPRFLHQQLRLDPKSFFSATGSSWKLGIRFKWGRPDGSNFNYGFEQVLTAQPPTLRKRVAHYCLDSTADAGVHSALMDRDLSPLTSANGQYQFIPGGAYHIPNRRFLIYLKHIAEQLGVRFVEGDVSDVSQSPEGDVTSVNLEGGTSVSADMFVDCSGFRSLLLNKTLGVNKVSYSDTLFCDKVIIGSHKRSGPVLPYTTSETMERGWCWQIEFDDSVTRGYVYSSRFCDSETAMRELKAKNPDLGDDLQELSFPSCRYENYWVRNVMAIGNSSGFVEPLEATSLHLIAVQLSSVCGSLLDTGLRPEPYVQKVINRQYRTMWDDVRDFLSVHYKFNRRLNSDFWKHCRAETGLGGAEELVEMYRQIGPHRLGETLLPRESIFRYEGYLTMLIGQGVETNFKAELNETDHREWNRHRQWVGKVIANALPVRDALSIVSDPSFRWPQGRVASKN